MLILLYIIYLLVKPQNDITTIYHVDVEHIFMRRARGISSRNNGNDLFNTNDHYQVNFFQTNATIHWMLYHISRNFHYTHRIDTNIPPKLHYTQRIEYTSIFLLQHHTQRIEHDALFTHIIQSYDWYCQCVINNITNVYYGISQRAYACNMFTILRVVNNCFNYE